MEDKRKKKHKKKHKKHYSSDDTNHHRKHKKKSRVEETYDSDAEKKAKDLELVKANQLVESLGYSNIDNPFGDSNLTEKFVWKKRDDKRPVKKHEDKLTEIKDIRKRREEHELKLMERQKKRDEEVRDKEKSAYADWEDKEKIFFQEQDKNRARIRITHGRSKPIDAIANNLLIFEEIKRASELEKSVDISVLLGKSSKVDPRVPYSVFDGLNHDQISQLQIDIREYMEADVHNAEFWQWMTDIAEFKLHEDVKLLSDRSLSEKINEQVEGKTLDELTTIQKSIPMEDHKSYWDMVLKRVTIEICKAKVRNFHKDILDAVKSQRDIQVFEKVKEKVEEKESKIKVPESPPSVKAGSNPVIDELEDLVNRSRLRMQVMIKEENINAHRIYSSATIPRLVTNEDVHLRPDEELLERMDEVDVGNEIPEWHNRLLPRKPKYVGIIKTGFTWSKYNSAHYDEDNPPPKSILSYKFTLYYPELVDKSVAPKFKLLPTETPEFMILCFSAGPPYIDIAFRIVNKPWDTSRKYGYKSSFEKGVLELHFKFQQVTYRR